MEWGRKYSIGLSTRCSSAEQTKLQACMSSTLEQFHSLLSSIFIQSVSTELFLLSIYQLFVRYSDKSLFIYLLTHFIHHWLVLLDKVWHHYFVSTAAWVLFINFKIVPQTLWRTTCVVHSTYSNTTRTLALAFYGKQLTNSTIYIGSAKQWVRSYDTEWFILLNAGTETKSCEKDELKLKQIRMMKVSV